MDLPLSQKEPLNAARSRNSDPPNGDHLFSFLREPLPTIPTSSQPQPPSSPPNDLKSTLHRRFTTNTYVSPIGQTRKPAAEPPVPDVSSIFQPRTTPSEKKKAEYEYLRQKQQQRQSRMNQLNIENRREEQELYRLRQELGFGSLIGHQSEPTTPPEIRDSGFPSALSKPNRFSASNLISPLGLLGRRTPGDTSHLNSPPNERTRAYNALTSAAPDKSTPQSRQESDVEEDNDETLDVNHRSAASLNRNSMPVTRRDLAGQDNTPEWDPSLGHVDTAAFLWGRENNQMAPSDTASQSTGRPKPAYQFHEVDDFPVLSQQKGESSAGKGKMKLQNSSQADVEAIEKESPTHSDHSRAMYRRSFPAHTGSGYSIHSDIEAGVGTSMPSTKANQAINRHSTGLSMGFSHQDSQFASASNSGYGSVVPSTPGSESGDLPPKLQTSYSTNDIPTMKNKESNGKPKESAGPSAYQTPQTSTAEQRLHNHNASLGRIPPGAINTNRHARDFSGGLERADEPKSDVSSAHTASTPRPSFQSPTANNQSVESPTGNSSATSPMSPFGQNPMLGPYGYGPALTNSLNQLSINAQGGWNPAAVQPYGSPSWNYNPYQSYGPSYPRVQDSQARVVQERRQRDSQDSSSQQNFNQPLENYRGEIFTMCKDQNGCRFLQKKVEEGNASNLEMIFNEIKDSIAELMVDPFANYLCQKLLDFASPEQRTVLLYNAASDMLNIGLNQHGTRALQKMIDHVSTDEQIHALTIALRSDVVRLIQDLNGNHVIQKCLNKLKPNEVQFIMDAVADSITIVGRHRHGCCVIQRCIDHANTEQKTQLVSAIVDESIPLIRDAFGNYVLQYVFDQADETFNNTLARTFLGRVVLLSKEKFSSNVIEKSIRISNTQTKHDLIEELLQHDEFDKLVDDPFANYVLQTALEYAHPEDENRLVEKIRPILPLLRNKPHGRRFQSRLSDRDKRINFPSSANGHMTPQHSGGNFGTSQPMPYPYGGGGGGGFNMGGQSTPGMSNSGMYAPHTPVPQNPGLNVNPLGSPSFGHPHYPGSNQSPAPQYRPSNFPFPGMGPVGGHQGMGGPMGGHQGMPPMNGMNPQWYQQFYGGGGGGGRGY